MIDRVRKDELPMSQSCSDELVKGAPHLRKSNEQAETNPTAVMFIACLHDLWQAGPAKMSCEFISSFSDRFMEVTAPLATVQRKAVFARARVI